MLDISALRAHFEAVNVAENIKVEGFCDLSPVTFNLITGAL
jgi:hypothetical protein